MATVRMDDRQVTIELTRWERLFAGGRARFVLPREAIASTDFVEHPTRWQATPGGRSGIIVTGVLKVGRWGVGTRTRLFVSARRWIPAVRFGLTPEGADLTGYDAFLISTEDAAALTRTHQPA
ncbi:hypothetical protein FB561_0677 [Kribbella amoyensis]|uniref:PH (Pleckstrin Homology) domain-containing protein n=1 Tax=Kribbella amoyensis TaxID=996641 RepID=A0A561BL96_9ACTN|nr:hypothetical protein [Kribbella amoyensis]TWD79613.1 hypothetical protein FB561_0677 [Kribbella amoyensis]